MSTNLNPRTTSDIGDIDFLDQDEDLQDAVAFILSYSEYGMPNEQTTIDGEIFADWHLPTDNVPSDTSAIQPSAFRESGSGESSSSHSSQHHGLGDEQLANGSSSPMAPEEPKEKVPQHVEISSTSSARTPESSDGSVSSISLLNQVDVENLSNMRESSNASMSPMLEVTPCQGNIRSNSVSPSLSMDEELHDYEWFTTSLSSRPKSSNVKNKLRGKIQSRPMKNLTVKNEEDKKMQRKLKNCQSAKRSREKKKDEHQVLKKNNERLAQRNNRLESDEKELSHIYERCLQIKQSFKHGCDLFKPKAATCQSSTFPQHLLLESGTSSTNVMQIGRSPESQQFVSFCPKLVNLSRNIDESGFLHNDWDTGNEMNYHTGQGYQETDIDTFQPLSDMIEKLVTDEDNTEIHDSLNTTKPLSLFSVMKGKAKDNENCPNISLQTNEAQSKNSSYEKYNFQIGELNRSLTLGGPRKSIVDCNLTNMERSLISRSQKKDFSEDPWKINSPVEDGDYSFLSTRTTSDGNKNTSHTVVQNDGIFHG